MHVARPKGRGGRGVGVAVERVLRVPGPVLVLLLAVASQAAPLDLAGLREAGAVTAEAATLSWTEGDPAILGLRGEAGSATLHLALGEMPPGFVHLTLEARSPERAGAVEVGIGDPGRGGGGGLGPFGARRLWLDSSWRTHRVLLGVPPDASSRLALRLADVTSAEIRSLRIAPPPAPPLFGTGLQNGAFELGLAGWKGSGLRWRASGGMEDSAFASLTAASGPGDPVYWTYPLPRVSPASGFLLESAEPLRLPEGESELRLTIRGEPVGGRVAVRIEQFGGQPLEATLQVGPAWQPCAVRIRSGARLAALKIAAAPGPPVTRLDVDSVSLVPASGAPEDPTPIEWTATPSREGGVYAPGDAMAVVLSARQSLPGAEAASRAVPFGIRAESALGTTLAETTVELSLPADGRVTELTVPVAMAGSGHARVTVTPGAPGLAPRVVSLARFPVHRESDSRLGVSWGWSDDAKFRVARDAGIAWVRDWSAAWEVSEPLPGQRSLLTAATMLDRYANLGLHVLECLPFPSTEWSAVSGAESGRWPGPRAEMPADPTLLAAHLRDFAAQLGPRFDAFEMLEEPITSGWSLPSARYSPDDYVALCSLAREALTDGGWEGEMVGGPGLLPGRAPTGLYEQFVSSGVGPFLDGWVLHAYLGALPAEGLIDRIRVASTRAGSPPLWLTELELTGEGAPWAGPPGSGASELDAAESLVRAVALGAEEGVQRVFLVAAPEAGRPDPLFSRSGEPRALLPTVAALAGLLPPSSIAAGRVELREAVGLLFETPGGAVAVICPGYGRQGALPLPEGVRGIDLVGGDLVEAPTGDLPYYLLAEGAPAASLAKALNGG